MAGGLAAAGRATLGLAETAGLVLRLVWGVAAALLRGRLPLREVLRQLHHSGVQCLPVMALASVCVGAIVAVQGVGYVHRYSAPEVFGWAAYFAACREVGPLLVGLILSARLGAHNAAQLAALSVTDRVEAMQALGVDPLGVWAAPRVVAMPIAAVLLMVWADALALVSATLVAWVLGPVSPWVTLASILNYAVWSDLVLGLEKVAAYGLVAAVTSTALGLAARGGADAVGTAVMRTAVTSLLAVAVMHQALTVWTAR